MNALVQDVMTTDVYSVRKDTTYEAIAAELREHRISAVPVLDEAGRVIGVVSESDMLAKLALDMGDGRGVTEIAGILPWHQLQKARAITAEQLMTSPPCTADPEDTVEHAAKIMYRRKVKRLPVIDAEGHLTGIVSRTDLLAVYSRSDADISEEIRTTIFPGQAHFPHGPYQATVQAGVVTLTGAPMTAPQRWDLVEQVQHVQGVVAVRDRLTHPVPQLGAYDVLAHSQVD
jgi:CBS domain-containing protein